MTRVQHLLGIDVARNAQSDKTAYRSLGSPVLTWFSASTKGVCIRDIPPVAAVLGLR